MLKAKYISSASAKKNPTIQPRRGMEQNDLQQVDLLKIFDSSGRVSEVVNGKRGISKAQAKALGEFFKESPELFI